MIRNILCWLGIHHPLLRWEYPNRKIYACYYCEKVTKEKYLMSKPYATDWKLLDNSSVEYSKKA